MDALFWIEQEQAASDDEVFLPADTPVGLTSVHSLKAQRRVLDERHRRLIKRLLRKQSAEMEELSKTFVKQVDPKRLPHDPSPLLEFMDGPSFLEANRDLVLLKSPLESNTNNSEMSALPKTDTLAQHAYYMQMEGVFHSSFDDIRRQHDNELSECQRLYLEDVSTIDQKANAPLAIDTGRLASDSTKAISSPPQPLFSAPSSPSIPQNPFPPTHITNPSRDPRLRLQQQQQQQLEPQLPEQQLPEQQPLEQQPPEQPQGERMHIDQNPHLQQDQVRSKLSLKKSKRRKKRSKHKAVTDPRVNDPPLPQEQVSKPNLSAETSQPPHDTRIPVVASSSSTKTPMIMTLKKSSKKPPKMMDQGTIAITNNPEGAGGPQVVCRTNTSQIPLGHPNLYGDALLSKNARSKKDPVYVSMVDNRPHFFAWRPDVRQTVNVGPVKEIEPLVRQFLLRFGSRPADY